MVDEAMSTFEDRGACANQTKHFTCLGGHIKVKHVHPWPLPRVHVDELELVYCT